MLIAFVTGLIDMVNFVFLRTKMRYGENIQVRFPASADDIHIFHMQAVDHFRSLNPVLEETSHQYDVEIFRHAAGLSPVQPGSRYGVITFVVEAGGHQ
jgi:uncharacterized membrane-anchored protein YhcB (DUF1043 family)